MPRELLEAKKLELIQEKVCESIAPCSSSSADHYNIRLKQTRLLVKSSAVRSRTTSAKEISTASGNESAASAVAVGLTETTMITAAEVLAGHVPRHHDIEAHAGVTISGKSREGGLTPTFRMGVESAARPGAKVRNQGRLILCLLHDASEEVMIAQPTQGDVMSPIRQHPLLVQDLGKAIWAEAENVVIVETDPTHLLIALAHHRLDHAVGGARPLYHRAAYRPIQQEPGLELADRDRLLRDLVPAH